MRVLDPIVDRAHPRPPVHEPQTARALGTVPIAVALAVTGLAAALVLFSADDGNLTDRAPVPVVQSSPPVVTVQPTTPPPPVADAGAVALAPDPALLEAVAAFERFARMVNLGDSQAVMALMWSEPIPPTAFRRAEWPHLPTDAGWWGDGGVDVERVQGFVRYIFTIPGSVFLSDCRGTSHADRLARVTCSYETVGGPLQALGQDIERGHLHATMLDGVVASVERHGSIDRALWARLADWTAERYPELYLASLGTPGERQAFDPVYTGNSALEHVGLATEMARNQ